VEWVWVCTPTLFVECGMFSAKGITVGKGPTLLGKLLHFLVCFRLLVSISEACMYKLMGFFYFQQQIHVLGE